LWAPLRRRSDRLPNFPYEDRVVLNKPVSASCPD
jgi:hypothetical protein